MGKEDTLIVGIDICNDFTQLAYFDFTEFKPISIMYENGHEERLIPTKLGFHKATGQLLLEENEDEMASADGVFWVEDLLKSFEEGRLIYLNNETYESRALMEEFIKKLLDFISFHLPNKELAFISLCFQIVTKPMISGMKEIMNHLGLRGRYTLLDHEEAFFYHTIHQKKEKRHNDVAIFELEEGALSFRVLHFDDRSQPSIAKISERYETEDLSRKMVTDNEEEAISVFENLAFMALERRYISNLYAVGRGFLTSWADGVLRKLSPGRHVFRGQNLFVQGACYLAREKFLGRADEILFLGTDRIAAGVSILAIKDGKEREVVLVEPSLKWYEADVTIDVIVKGEDELSLQIKDFLSKKIDRRFLSLSGLHFSGKEVSRIRVNINFRDRNTCVIKALDLGFGSFVATTNRVWELTWEK